MIHSYIYLLMLELLGVHLGWVNLTDCNLKLLFEIINVWETKIGLIIFCLVFKEKTYLNILTRGEIYLKNNNHYFW